MELQSCRGSISLKNSGQAILVFEGLSLVPQYDRISPQSGQVQVTWLQVMPQAFSSMQTWQIMKPQMHFQQNLTSILQQGQV